MTPSYKHLDELDGGLADGHWNLLKAHISIAAIDLLVLPLLLLKENESQKLAGCQGKKMILNLVYLHDLDMNDPMIIQCLRH